MNENRFFSTIVDTGVRRWPVESSAVDHQCGNYHYGRMNLVRACCVAHAEYWRRTARQVAITDGHPAMQAAIEAWNSLTDSEMDLLGGTFNEG